MSFETHYHLFSGTYTLTPAATKADLLPTWQLADLDGIAIGANREKGCVTCSVCGHLMRTEGEFARHYVIPDATYLNLGDCPTRGLVTSTINVKFL